MNERLNHLLDSFKNSFEPEQRPPIYTAAEENVLDRILPDYSELETFETHVSPVLAFAIVFFAFLLPIILVMWLIWPKADSVTGIVLVVLAVALLMGSGYIVSIKGIDVIIKRAKEKNKQKLLAYIEQAYKQHQPEIDAYLHEKDLSSVSEPLKRAADGDINTIESLYKKAGSEEKQYSLTKVVSLKNSTASHWELFHKETYRKEERAFYHRIAVYYRIMEHDGEKKLIEFGESGSFT